MALVDQAMVQHYRDEAGKLSGLRALVRNFESTDGRAEPVNVERAAFTTARIFDQDGQVEIANLIHAVLNGALTPDKVPVLLSALQQSQRDKAEGEEQEKQKARDAWLRQQLLQLADIDHRLGELSHQKTALGNVLADIRSGKGPDLDADGTLKDKKAEAAIREYERKHRTKIDRGNDAQVSKVFQDIGDQEQQLTKQRGDVERGIKARLEGAAPGAQTRAVISEARAATDENDFNSGVAAVASVETRSEVVKARAFDTRTEQVAIDLIQNGGADAFGDEGAFSPRKDDPSLAPSAEGRDVPVAVGSVAQGELTGTFNGKAQGAAATASLDPGLDPKPRGPA